MTDGASPPATRPKPRVLLIDDYDLILNALERLLREECLVVGRAATATEALDGARALRPDIVVLDLCLPSASTIALCRRLRRIQPKVSIVLMSAVDEADLQTAARIADASAFVPKAKIGEVLPAVIRDLWSKADRNGA